MSVYAMLAAGAKPHTLVSSDPAANNEASISITVGGRGFLIINATLTVAQGLTQTPLPSLQIKDASGNVVASFNGSSAAMSASTTSTFNWYNGAALTAGAGATFNTSPLPEGVVVKNGWTVQTSTAGKGANTDLGPLLLVGLKLT